jgi:myo-inositol-1-phosphate synthase
MATSILQRDNLYRQYLEVQELQQYTSAHACEAEQWYAKAKAAATLAFIFSIPTAVVFIVLAVQR